LQNNAEVIVRQNVMGLGRMAAATGAEPVLRPPRPGHLQQEVLQLKVAERPRECHGLPVLGRRAQHTGPVPYRPRACHQRIKIKKRPPGHNYTLPITQ
jgi:hypothetical protein